MNGLSHVVLHIGFCSAIARLNAQAPVAIRVRLVDSGKDVEYEHLYRLERGEEDQSDVEFDVHRGLYRLTIEAQGDKCTASDFLYFLPDHDRSITEKLVDGIAQPTEPMLLFGAAPMTFTYAKPTFVLVDKNVACKAPVGTLLPVSIQVERDRDSYYTWLYNTPAIDALGSVTVALRLATVTGQYHYVRVPMPFPAGWHGWPIAVQFDVTEDQIDGIAGDPVDVLLCPKLWKTSVG